MDVVAILLVLLGGICSLNSLEFNYQNDDFQVYIQVNNILAYLPLALCGGLMVSFFDYRVKAGYRKNTGYAIDLERLPHFYILCVCYAVLEPTEKWGIFLLLGSLCLIICWGLNTSTLLKVWEVREGYLSLTAVVGSTLLDYPPNAPELLIVIKLGLVLYFLYKYK